MAWPGAECCFCVWMQGLYQERPPLPFVPGAEVFGVVTEVGAKVRRVAKGDKVKFVAVILLQLWYIAVSTVTMCCFCWREFFG